MPRETLTKEQIVRTAIDLLDSEGLAGLNMRNLGARLNSAATAVYWHVKSKDNLVILAGDEVWREISLPATEPWREAASSMAHGLYSMLTRHPWLVTCMSTHPIHGPGKMRHDDHALAVYEAAGFVGTDADWALSTVFLFVLGQAMGHAAQVEADLRAQRDGKSADVSAEVVALAQQFPRLKARLETYADEPDRSFEFGLETILDGLETRLLNGGLHSVASTDKTHIS
ncbi:TetR family transcriptional regulator [Kibdelosporangium aridum]|uniref:TetR family transcriptional regulator n=1 Tax=Kibdelosporangium aridum TaxID=2030 RepID=A0A428Z8H5_KIBAR|nr:TetR/AcrR family transcriptional regulator C-terminal domain-containing protein [Kibdelosporangium aridum]RSM84306.1 TetR family transcriptional regulator [Kibdelosporangium aridum]